ncbi:MAG: hypothetical protein V2A73_06265 [Pseudomonadota bacterium]
MRSFAYMTNRLLARAVLVLAFLLACPVGAQPKATEPDPRAEALNEEGKEFFRGKDYAAAAARFREAAELSPDARYYFNLCVALEKLEDLEGALQACDTVYTLRPSDDLKAKTGQRAASIRQLKRQEQPQAGTGETASGGKPEASVSRPPDQTGRHDEDEPRPQAVADANGTGDATGDGEQDADTRGRPRVRHHRRPQPRSTTTVTASAEPDMSYRWSLGGSIGPAGTNINGEAKSAGSLRLHGSLLLSQERNLGIQLYLGSTTTDAAGGGEVFMITDVGGAAFWHRRLRGRFVFTPLLGLHVTTILTENANDEYFPTVGLRLDALFSYVVGRHEFWAGPSLSLYAAAGKSMPNAYHEAAEYGLDEGGRILSVQFGYSYRFEMPLVSGLAILE